jgi:hypothetical protein
MLKWRELLAGWVGRAWTWWVPVLRRWLILLELRYHIYIKMSNEFGGWCVARVLTSTAWVACLRTSQSGVRSLAKAATLERSGNERR